MKRIVILLAMAPALLGAQCEGTQTIVAPANIPEQRLNEIVPKDLLTCLREPDGSAVTTIRQSARYIVNLKAAGRDCRRKLAAVRALIEQEGR